LAIICNETSSIAAFFVPSAGSVERVRNIDDNDLQSKEIKKTFDVHLANEVAALMPVTTVPHLHAMNGTKSTMSERLFFNLYQNSALLQSNESFSLIGGGTTKTVK